eukprot:CAMPEP_0114595422 /NCGR_PEP_ID=MMETSP0125-20121206/17212_1 /TAXON_ID=485358 ORGANISM="Aristerostoma sp., Strain ATCC 50986" /NCGR_SAMPLE_ID=MMETSP0125 /ASSEMBLY_ACC=CAM_ASM_000245 /LENGTH=105 /DNA_ID=CAMNT_0001796977 /DNA_START=285 /DNA_END=599 /DNA_ORIENTATION=+
MNNKSKNKSTWNQVEPMFEIISHGIIADAVGFFVSHKVYDISSGSNVQQFHDKEIKSLVTESVDDIKISGDENNEIYFLGLAGNSQTVFGVSDLEDQNDEGGKME